LKRSALPKPAAKKKCSVCKAWFEPFNTIQPTCGLKCALIKAVDDRVKKEKRVKKDGLELLKSKSDHLKDGQVAFNAFIRERDRDWPCISCGKFHTGQYHAGHYRSVGAAPQLRFNEDNVHKQCQPCNLHKSGNAIEYRINLVKRIGVARVEALECDNSLPKWTVEEIKAIKMEYRTKLKELIKERERNEK
jgi:hypothetical protein